MFLVVSDETDSVVVQAGSLSMAVAFAYELGYVTGYVTNQDGGRRDLAELIDEFGYKED